MVRGEDILGRSSSEVGGLASTDGGEQATSSAKHILIFGLERVSSVTMAWSGGLTGLISKFWPSWCPGPKANFRDRSVLGLKAALAGQRDDHRLRRG
jgi:hypothetical protein